MLRDVLERDKKFGIIYPGDDTLRHSELPPIGSVGCTVEVIANQEMPDGRSNILCAGTTRFFVRRYVEGKLYHQAEVEYFDDELILDDLTEEIAHAEEVFKQLVAVGKKMREIDESDMPELPHDAASLSYIIAASLDVSLEEKQEWLEMTDPAIRLREVTERMAGLIEDYEKRVEIQKIAKSNGHGGKLPG